MKKVAPNPSFKISRFRARRGDGGGGGKNEWGGNGGGSGTIESKGEDGKGKDGKRIFCDCERDDCERCFELAVSSYIQRKRLQRIFQGPKAADPRLPTPFPGGWGVDDPDGIDYQTMQETFFPMDCNASSTTIDLAGAATPVSAAEMMEEAEILKKLRVPGEMERVLAEKSMAMAEGPWQWMGKVPGEMDITDWDRCGLAVPSLIFFSLHARPARPLQLPAVPPTRPAQSTPPVLVWTMQVLPSCTCRFFVFEEIMEFNLK